MMMDYVEWIFLIAFFVIIVLTIREILRTGK